MPCRAVTRDGDRGAARPLRSSDRLGKRTVKATTTSERARVGWAPAAGWRAAVCSCAVVGWQIVGPASGPTSAAVPAGESLARGPPKQGKLREGSFLPAHGLGFSFFKGCEA